MSIAGRFVTIFSFIILILGSWNYAMYIGIFSLVFVALGILGTLLAAFGTRLCYINRMSLKDRREFGKFGLAVSVLIGVLGTTAKLIQALYVVDSHNVMSVRLAVALHPLLYGLLIAVILFLPLCGGYGEKK